MSILHSLQQSEGTDLWDEHSSGDENGFIPRLTGGLHPHSCFIVYRFYCCLPNVRYMMCQVICWIKRWGSNFVSKIGQKRNKIKGVVDHPAQCVCWSWMRTCSEWTIWPPGALCHFCVHSPGWGLHVIVCRQIINSTKVRAAPRPLPRGCAHARSLRFSLDDFLTVPFLFSSFNTFSLWSSTFIMVSLASVTWSITSLQRCILPWRHMHRSP